MGIKELVATTFRQIGKEEGEDVKAEKVAMKLLKAGTLSVHDIADIIEKEVAFVQGIKAQLDSGATE